MRIGKDALISVLARFVHPSKHIRDKYPNTWKDERLQNCRVTAQGKKVVNRKEQLCFLFENDDFPGIELYATQRYCKLEVAGPSDLLFDNASFTAVVEGQEVVQPPSRISELDRLELSEIELAELRADGLQVDHDTLPAPENTPTAPSNNSDVQYGAWGSVPLCPRVSQGCPNVRAKMKNCANVCNMMSPLALFNVLFPMSYVKTVLLPATNEILDNPMTLGEFFRFLGIHLLFATTQGCARAEFWSQKPISPFEGAPFRVAHIMTRRRFEAILSALTLTDKPPPEFLDRFWKIRTIVQAWNDNMRDEFFSSWRNCLDESMMVWTNEWTAPGFMVVPRKPKPFGNEWHTICCGETGILFYMELVEGKDRPVEIPAEMEIFDGTQMKTVGLLLRMTRHIWNTGKVVILDSGFCVLRGIVELAKRGVFASAVIKKRRYWPKHIDGEAIKEHFHDKPIGSYDSLPGTLQGIPFAVHCQKEENYVMSLMTTYGSLNTGREAKRQLSDGTKVSFNLIETHEMHYNNRHQVDDFNNRRHNPISFEETWATKRWEIRVFAHLVACTEQNSKLAYEYFGQREKMTVLDFRRMLAKEMIENDFDEQGGQRTTRKRKAMATTAHTLCRVAKHTKFDGTQFVHCKVAYQQWKCRGCVRQVRTYCSCNPGYILCGNCFGHHVAGLSELSQQSI